MQNLKTIFLKYKAIILPGLVALTSFAVLFLVLLPQFFNLITGQDEIARLERRIDNLQVKANELSGIDVSLYERYLRVAYNAVPEDREVPQALTVLQALLSTRNLVWEDLRYAPGSSAQRQSNFQLNLTVSGNLSDLRSFLIDLRNSPRLFIVEGLSTQTIRAGNIVSAEVRLIAFYEPIPTNLGQLEEPLPSPGLKAEDQAFLERLESSFSEVPPITGDFIPRGKQNPFE
jgi:Tfp pilus assembly protein PilO